MRKYSLFFGCVALATVIAPGGAFAQRTNSGLGVGSGLSGTSSPSTNGAFNNNGSNEGTGVPGSEGTGPILGGTATVPTSTTVTEPTSATVTTPSSVTVTAPTSGTTTFSNAPVATPPVGPSGTGH